MQNWWLKLWLEKSKLLCTRILQHLKIPIFAATLLATLVGCSSGDSSFNTSTISTGATYQEINSATDARSSQGSGTNTNVSPEANNVASTPPRPRIGVLNIGSFDAEGLTIAYDIDGNATATALSTSNAAAGVQRGMTLSNPYKNISQPLGFAAVVDNVRQDASGSPIATLVPATLGDVFAKISMPQETQSLDTSNFIGVIGGSRFNIRSSAGSSSSFEKTLGKKQVSALGGSVLIGDGDIASKGGQLDFDLTLNLADWVEDASALKPYGAAAQPLVRVTAQVRNLKVSAVVNADTTPASGLQTDAHQVNLRVSGDLTSKAEVSGGFSVSFGNFNRSWKEVESSAARFLGMSAKISGLSSKDKVGKIPLFGLAFSTKCPSVCFYTFGKTQTAIRSTANGGVILWFYIDAKGNLTLDGSLSAHANGAFDFGVTTGADQSMEPVFESQISKQMPVIKGELKGNALIGTTIAADFFIMGVRAGSASFFTGAQTEATFNGEYLGLGVDTTLDLACKSPQLAVGAGFILKADLNFGLSIKSGIFNKEVLENSFNYSGQWPSETQLKQPGVSVLEGTKIPLWIFKEGNNENSEKACIQVTKVVCDQNKILIEGIARVATPNLLISSQNEAPTIVGFDQETSSFYDPIDTPLALTGQLDSFSSQCEQWTAKAFTSGSSYCRRASADPLETTWKAQMVARVKNPRTLVFSARVIGGADLTPLFRYKGNPYPPGTRYPVNEYWPLLDAVATAYVNVPKCPGTYSF